MPRVIGIDPGTITVDICGLDDGVVFLESSIPTSEALADSSSLLALIKAHSPVDLVAGPSGYGLPCVSARDATEDDLRLAALAPTGTTSGIAGLRRLMRLLAHAAAPVLFTPGVIHLPTVPVHRKINRVDMGTADKVAAATLALYEHARAGSCPPSDASFIFLELGGAFTAAIAVARGRIVDGVGGSAGPMGLAASGALDGEVAFLAGDVSKEMIFRGGVTTIAPEDDPFAAGFPRTPRGRIAWNAYLEGVARVTAAMSLSAGTRAVVLSGRLVRAAWLLEPVERVLREAGFIPEVLAGLGSPSKHAAQGAALMADGFMGGKARSIVQSLELRGAAGTVLDHLHVVSRARALDRLNSKS